MLCFNSADKRDAPLSSLVMNWFGVKSSKRRPAPQQNQPGQGFSRCPTSVEAVLPFLQSSVDEGSSLLLSKDHPAGVYIAGLGMVQFRVDENGKVVPLA